MNEAMCFNLSIIVSDLVGCASDLVHSGENGFVFRSGDIEMLTKCMFAIADDEEKRRRFGEKSESIIKNYSYDSDVEGIRRALQLVQVRP